MKEYCPHQWPVEGTHRQYWMCDLLAGHDGDHATYWSGSKQVRCTSPARRIKSGNQQPSTDSLAAAVGVLRDRWNQAALDAPNSETASLAAAFAWELTNTLNFPAVVRSAPVAAETALCNGDGGEPTQGAAAMDESDDACPCGSGPTDPCPGIHAVAGNPDSETSIPSTWCPGKTRWHPPTTKEQP